MKDQTSYETAMSTLESLMEEKIAEMENKYNQYLEEHPDATEEEKQSYQTQLQLEVYSFTFSVSPFKTGTIVAGDDYTVTGIASNAFANNTTIQSISIPESIISIAPNAFGGCTLLDRIIFENTENWNYSNILSSEYIDGDTIDSAIMANPTAVVEYLTGTYSSYYLVNGEYAVMLPFVIEDGVITDYIGSGGVVTIPASYSIADDGTIIKGTDYKILAIDEAVNIYPGGGTPSYVGPFMRNSSITKIIIEENGITSIPANTFQYCSSLTSITIPANVTSIGGSAFSGCNNLATIIFEEGSQLKSIGNYAFQDCSSLSSITIPASVTSIGDSAFYRCYSLVYIVNKSALEFNVGDYGTSTSNNPILEIVSDESEVVFVDIDGNRYKDYNGERYFIKNLDGSSEIEIDSSCTQIYQYAFYNRYDIRSVTIPASVTSIGNNAFSGCWNLANVYYEGTIDEWVAISFSNYNANPLYNGDNLYVNSDELVTEVSIDTATKINDYVFYGYDTLTKLTIGSQVTSIGEEAFYNCSNLATVIFEEGSQLESIGNSAFSGCSSLSSITIPENVTSIGNSAFSGCTGLIEINYNATNLADLSRNNYVFSNAGKDGTGITVNIGVNVTRIPAYLFCPYYSNLSYSPNIVTVNFAEDGQCTEIGNYAFRNCSSLTSITIPASVTSIGSYAFSGCTGFTSITIPASVASIGSYAFSGCNNLNTIAFENSNGWWVQYNSNTIELNSADIENTETLITYLTSTYDNYTWYRTDTKIPFLITSDGILLKYVGSDTDVVIPSTYSISEDGEVIAGDDYSVTSIGDYAFYYCDGLTNITIPASVASIGSSAFSGCNNLATIIFEEGSQLKSIGNYAFQNCSSLSSITIPASVTSIGEAAFSRCSNLANVYYGGTIEEWMAISFVIDYYVSANPLYNGANLYVNGDELVTEVNINTATIKSYVFYGCESLTKVTIGSQVTSIGRYAFSGCGNLANVYYEGTIEEWMEISFDSDGNPLSNGANLYVNGNQLVTEVNINTATIKSYVFYGCESLTKVTIGSQVTSIGSYAFSGCSNLANVYYEGTIEEWMEISFPNASANPLYYGANLYVNGDELVTEVSIDSSSTIKSYVFHGYERLTKVTIGSQVTSIGSNAFDGCSNLETVIIEEGSQLKSIISNAFSGCSSLSSITIPASVTSIGWSAFEGCSNLANVYYEGTIDEWMEISFGGSSANPLCNGANLYVNGDELVREVSIDTATTINDYVFYGCESLTKVTIGSQVTSIGSTAFDGCSNLETVIIEEGSQLKSIGSDAFSGCSSLSSITIPASVTSIGWSAFEGCSNLATVIIESNYAYKNAGTNFPNCGYLLLRAREVRVLTSCIGDSTNSYLENTSNFTKTTDGEYTVYTKVS